MTAGAFWCPGNLYDCFLFSTGNRGSSGLSLQGYAAAGQTEAALDSLRWIADYFVKNHHGDLAFTGQIGNVQEDHASWGRPEDMTAPRPGFDLTPTAPG